MLDASLAHRLEVVLLRESPTHAAGRPHFVDGQDDVDAPTAAEVDDHLVRVKAGETDRVPAAPGEAEGPLG